MAPAMAQGPPLNVERRVRLRTEVAFIEPYLGLADITEKQAAVQNLINRIRPEFHAIATEAVKVTGEGTKQRIEGSGGMTCRWPKTVFGGTHGYRLAEERVRAAQNQVDPSRDSEALI
jgi:hypothetical protein